MKKMSATTTLALLLVLVLGSTVAYASFNWCPDDPVLDIGGTTVNVIVWVPKEDVGLVNGPVHVKVKVPKSVDAVVTSYGDSFGKGPEKVTIEHKGKAKAGKPVKVEVKVKVPANEKLRVMVEIKAPGVHESKEGWTNEWVKRGAEVKVKWPDDDDGDHHDDD